MIGTDIAISFMMLPKSGRKGQMEIINHIYNKKDMIHAQIDELIRNAMKAHENEKRDVLRLIKTEFLKYNTSKEGAGKEMDEEKEFAILKKMVAQRQDAIAQYNKANRPELAEKERKELDIISGFLPAVPTEEELTACAKSVIEARPEANMGIIIKEVKAQLPMADGKTLAGIVRGLLN